MATEQTAQRTDLLRAHAAGVVHRGTDDKTRTVLAELFGQDVFLDRHDLTHEEACRLVYERMRFLNQRLPPASALLREDLPRLFALLEWSAPVSPSLCFAMLVHYLLCVACVVELGSECDLADQLAELESMAAIGVFVITEIGQGGSHVSPGTEATYDPDRHDFVLHTPTPAAAKFMPNVALSGVPKLGIVTARLIVAGIDRGVFGFLVPIRGDDGTCPGVLVRALPETPSISLDHALVTFDQVRLPFRYWLRDGAAIDANGSFKDPVGGGDARLVRTLRVGANVWAAQAAACASASRASVATAIRFAHQRPTAARLTPGQPVIRYRTQQRALFGALATSYAVTCLANEVKTARVAASGAAQPSSASAGVTWAPWASVNRTGAIAKAVAAIAAGRVVGECRERCGALDLLSTSRFVGYEGLAHAFYPAGGDSMLILLDAARTLVTEVDGGQPPDRTAGLGGALDDRDVWMPLFRARESLLGTELAGELRRAERRGQSPFEVWNNRLDLAKDLAEAHGARLTLESFLAAVEAVPEPVARDVLESLCTIYVLSEISRHLGWFLCERLLSRKQVRRVPQLFNRYCERLMPYASALVDAFELPAPVQNTAIAVDDYVAAVMAGTEDVTNL